MTESTGEFRPETLVAIEAVKRAFAAARGGVAREEITIKEGRDLVTGADVAVEDVVRGVVGDTLGFPVIGEERGGRARPTARPTASSIQSVGRGTLPPESRCTA